MASLASEPGNRRRILVVGTDGKRYTLRLGKMPLKAARTALTHVEALDAARRSGGGIPPATAQWLGELPLTVHNRLVKAGLCGPRPAKAALGEFLQAYVKSRPDVKSATRTVYGHTKRNLLAFFGAQRAVASVTPADAVAFVRWLSESEGLAVNTARRRTGIARQFFAAAIRQDVIAKNPFAGIPVTVGANAERRYYVTEKDFATVLEVCPSAQWRFAFALCRYAGLRCSSEVTGLRWADVNWERRRFTVHSPKTAHHSGKDTRVVPIFEKLEPYLLEAFGEAQPGEPYCCPQFTNAAQMYRKMLLAVLSRAGVTPWPKLFVNLRASAATDIFAEYPAHVAAGWLGHSPQIALKHYLQTPETYFDRAAGVKGEPEKAAHNPAQYMPAKQCKTVKGEADTKKGIGPKPALCKDLRGDAVSYSAAVDENKNDMVGATGLEPVTSCV